MSPDPLARRSAARLLAVIVGVSVAARVAAAFLLGDTIEELPGIYDQISYHTLATRVAGGHGFSFATGWWPATQAGEPTAHWSYLYVTLLAGLYRLVGAHPLVARLVQAVVVGVLHPLLTHAIGRRLFGPRVALVAAAVVAGYAYFIYYAAALLTEPLYITAILWALVTAMRIGEGPGDGRRGRPAWLWLQLGVALGVAVLLRQLMLFVAPIVIAWAAWRAWRTDRSEAAPARRAALVAGRAAIALVVIAAAIAPWTARNYRAFGQFVLLNTNAGFAFYWGNHPVHGSRFIPLLGTAEYAALIPDELGSLSEAALDRELMRRGLGFVAAEPGRFLALSLSRIPEYFKFWPSAGSGRVSNYARVLSFGLCLPFLIAGLVVAVRDLVSGAARFSSPSPPGAGERVGVRGPGPDAGSRAAAWLVLAVAAAYAGIHLATWTLVRYRLPVDAMLMPVTGLGILAAYDVVAQRFRRAGQRPGVGV